MTQIAYSPTEAAEQVGMSPRYITNAIANGDLKAHYIGGNTPRIKHADLEAWVDSQPTERKSA
jgi:excisionase family DNA binding protein